MHLRLVSNPRHYMYINLVGKHIAPALRRKPHGAGMSTGFWNFIHFYLRIAHVMTDFTSIEFTIQEITYFD